MRPTQTSITSAIASLEFFSVSSSPESSSLTFGQSIRLTDCGPHCERRFNNWRGCSKFLVPKVRSKRQKRTLIALIGETAKSFDQARRYVELTQFEFEESSATDQVSTSKLENILVRAEEIFASAKSLVQGDERQDQTRTALLSEITAEVQRLN